MMNSSFLWMKINHETQNFSTVDVPIGAKSLSRSARQNFGLRGAYPSSCRLPWLETSRRSVISSMEGLWILLKRMAYPCRCSDIIYRSEDVARQFSITLCTESPFCELLVGLSRESLGRDMLCSYNHSIDVEALTTKVQQHKWTNSVNKPVCSALVVVSMPDTW